MFGFRYPPQAEKAIREECANTGEELPADIKAKPNLHLGLALYLNAWHELDGERRRDDFQYIPRSACFAYADDYELDDEQREDLWFHVSRMDREFLPWWSKNKPKPKTPK